MKGNTINEFINDLLYSLGPEKEFIYANKFYFLEGDRIDGRNCLRLDVSTMLNEEPDEFIMTYIFYGKTNSQIVEKFEKEKIFDGKTIYEAEKDITVLYG